MSGDAEWMIDETTATTTNTVLTSAEPPVPAVSEIMVPYGLIALGVALALIAYGYTNSRVPRINRESLDQKMLSSEIANDMEGDEDEFLGDGSV